MATEEEVTFPDHNRQTAGEAIQTLNNSMAKRKRFKTARYKAKPFKFDLNDRLPVTIMAPNLWMVPPPKCNVIFPAQYSRIVFSRSWMSELTRMWLGGLSKRGKANWKENYFAPSADIITGPQKKDFRSVARAGTSFLLHHEIFSGIVPAISTVGDVAELKKINKIVEKIEEDEGAPNILWGGTAADKVRQGEGTSLGSFMKNPALQRAANAKFMQSRFMSRSLSVSGPFNPNVICGLPGLVIDHALSTRLPASLRTEAAAATEVGATGSHYLGLITSVTHTIGQQGASTSIGMNFCRTHDEGLEIFNKDHDGSATVEVIRTADAKGSKVPGGPYWAEVRGWTYKKQKGRYVSIPVIGMHGMKGRRGKHITWGLHKQDAPIKTDRRGFSFSDPASEILHSSDVDHGDNTTVETSRAYRYIYSVKPKMYRKEKNNTTVADHCHNPTHPTPDGTQETLDFTSATPVKITPKVSGAVTYHDGYKYTPPKQWMHHSAKAAEQVDAYLVAGQGQGRKFRYNFSFEQVARPPWFSEVYLNHNIGEKFYLPLVGCDALTDLSIVTLDPTQKSLDTGRKYELDMVSPGSDTSNAHTLTSKEQEALEALSQRGPGSATFIAGGPEKRLENLKNLEDFINTLSDEKFSEKTTLLVTQGEGDEEHKYILPAKVLGGYHIQDVVNHLALTYKEMLERNVDLKQFVDTFTNRNFACMVDIFGWSWWGDGSNIKGIPEKTDEGKPNPARDIIGTRHLLVMDTYQDGSRWLEESSEGQSDCVEGFHSAAFGDMGQMEQLDWDLLSTEGEVRAKDEPRKDADPRQGRRQAVLAYRDSLNYGLYGKSIITDDGE